MPVPDPNTPVAAGRRAGAMLTKDPSARATAADAAAALDAVISGRHATEPLRENGRPAATKLLIEPPVPPFPPPAPPVPRRPTRTASFALLGALCLLAVVTVGAVALWADRLHSGQAATAGGSTTVPSTTAAGPNSPASTTGPSAGRATLGVLLDVSYPGPGARIATVGTNGRPAVFPGGPAAMAGLQPGDIITAFGGSLVNNASVLVALVQHYAPGDRVPLTYQRYGLPMTVQVILSH